MEGVFVSPSRLAVLVGGLELLLGEREFRRLVDRSTGERCTISWYKEDIGTIHDGQNPKIVFLVIKLNASVNFRTSIVFLEDGDRIEVPE